MRSYDQEPGEKFERGSRTGQIDETLLIVFFFQPFQFQDSPYLFPYISCNVSSENLVIHQGNVVQLMISFILLTCLLDNVSIL